MFTAVASALSLAACGGTSTGTPASTGTPVSTVTAVSTGTQSTPTTATSATPLLTATPTTSLAPTPAPTPSGSALASSVPSSTPATGTGDTAIAAGYYHSCAITSTGGVECWGSNDSGQLGDGTTDNSSTPVAVGGLDGGVQALAAGVSHTCALTVAGGVMCWGWNLSGQLGNGKNDDSSSPVAVSGLESGVSAIGANGQYTCALTSAGAVMCWGSNFRGQLGDGKADDSSKPVAVLGLDSGVSGITAGDYHACAVFTSGAVECWGANEEGQLGNGKTKDSSKPVSVIGLGGPATAVSGGYQHTCVLTTVPDVECWGANDFGTLGDGTADGSLAPVVVSGLPSDVTSIEAGGYHTCAVSSTGGLVCWGASDYGQIGDGTTDPRSTPVPVTGLTGVSAFAAGYQQTCAMTGDGRVMCWGNNDYGQLGDGTTESSPTPVPVSGF